MHKMVVGLSRLEIFLPENHSLKEKRQAITRIVERTKGKFNISIMEIDQTNLWQKATVGFAVVGVKQDHVNCDHRERLALYRIHVYRKGHRVQNGDYGDRR